MRHKGQHPTPFRQWTSVFVRGVVLALLLLLLPALTGIGTAVSKVRRIIADTPSALTVPLPALPTPDPAKPIAVVLLSNNRTEITDSLPPYELLAASGAFNTYFVAPERRISPIATAQYLPFGVGGLPSGLDILPHYSFAEYERALGRAPDLIVIPYLTEFVPGSEGLILDWIRAHAGPETTVLAICAGSRVLVETGLLDGRAATGLHQDLAGFKERYPAVRWQAGVRWVEDGPFITSGTLTAGIDATLHTIERLAGRATAERAAQVVGYPHLERLDDATVDYQPPAAPDLGLVPNALYGWRDDDVGVLLYDGVSEIALAALLDTAALNLTHSYTLAPERALIRSRHGMIIVPRYSYADAPALDRVIVLNAPGSAEAAGAAVLWNTQSGQPQAETITTGAGTDFAYDAVLADLAEHVGVTVARSTAANLVYAVELAPENARAWTPILLVHAFSGDLLLLTLLVVMRYQRGQAQHTTPLPV